MGASPSSGEIAFHFDFASPFAYMAFQQIRAVADRHGRQVSYRPVDLAFLKKAAGNTGPSNREIPPKFAYLKHDLARWAEMYGVPFAFPDPAKAPASGARDATAALRAVPFAEKRGKAYDFIASFWRYTWGDGNFVGDPQMLQMAIADCGLDPDEVGRFIESPEAAASFERSTEAARQSGVFGVPTMICDGKMWWGNDRLEMLDRYLSQAAATQGAA